MSTFVDTSKPCGLGWSFSRACPIRGPLAELCAIAFFDPGCLYDTDGRLIPVDKLPETIRRVVSVDVSSNGARKSIRIADKLKALELLAKIQGMFTDRIDITTGGETIPKSSDPSGQQSNQTGARELNTLERSLIFLSVAG